MDKIEWKKIIKAQSEGVGTYQKEFDPLIDTLADILQQRDAAYKEFIDSGGETVVLVISDRGAENYRKNPRLQAWIDLNSQAMTFWKEMGLSPSSLKHLNDDAMKANKVSFGDVLKEIGI